MNKARTLVSCLYTAMTVFSLGLAQPAALATDLVLPTSKPVQKAVSKAASVPDELLVMASGSAEKDEFMSSIQDVQGTIVRTIGEGAATVYVVRTEKGKMAEVEGKLLKDKDIAIVQRNFLLKPQAHPNDPFYPSEWHLPTMNVPPAWARAKGEGQWLAIVDNGNPPVTRDLRTSRGFDTTLMQVGQKPYGDHGTMVATVAGATTNNKINTAAVAPSVNIFPIRVCDANGYISEAALTEAIYQCGKRGIRLINMSMNDAPPYSLSNRQYHPVFHIYADWFHNQKNGLIFISAGNDGREDFSPRSPNMIIVSALNTKKTLPRWATYGNNLWFTAPGEAMFCSDSKGRVVSVSGSSFSAPCVAAVAALVLSERPALKNVDVEQILIRTCYKADGRPYTKYFGYGLPNAAAAVDAARVWKISK